MANATLEVMQDIEFAATSVLAEYDDKIAKLRSQLQAELDRKVRSYEDDTNRQVQELSEKGQQHLADLKEALALTIKENDAKVRRALTDKKDDLVQQIVDKVVAQYGN